MERFRGFCVVAVVAGLAMWAYADSGREAATRVERGSYGGAFAVSVAETPTLIANSSPNRPDLTCMNNTGGALYLIPVSTMAYTSGFPIVSSATFRADAFSGIIWGLCDTAKAPCDVRCWSGNVY